MLEFGTASLVITDHKGQRHKFEINSDRVTLGRVDSNDIVIHDPAISSHHCEFVADRKGVMLRDLNSSNGTYLNQKRVEEGRLSDGDFVRVGQSSIKVQLRTFDGKAIRTGKGLKTVAVAMAVVAALVVLAAGGAWFALFLRNRSLDKDVLTKYDASMRAFLKDDPCAVIEPQTRQIERLEAQGSQKPRFSIEDGKVKLSKGDKIFDSRLLGSVRDREAPFQRAVQALEGYTGGQKAAMDAVAGVSKCGKDAKGVIRCSGFKSRALQAAAAEMHMLFTARTELTQRFIGDFKKLKDETARYGSLLDRMIKGDERAARDLEDYQWSSSVKELVDGCKSSHARSMNEALAKFSAMEVN